MVLVHGVCSSNGVRLSVAPARFSGQQKVCPPELRRLRGETPADEFGALASVFRRRLLAGVGTASLMAASANFAGVTSFLLGLPPEAGRSLKLDLLYPVQGYSRCLETTKGFEFIYPANWVGDQTLYRAVGKVDLERSLDPPPLKLLKRRLRNFKEPAVAFGPPGSNGELNASVIASQWKLLADQRKWERQLFQRLQVDPGRGM